MTFASKLRQAFSSPDTDPQPPDVHLDTLFDAIASKRRRQVVRTLVRDMDGESDLGTLAETIAAIEDGCTPNELESDRRKAVYVSLYQCHLPHLDDAGIVEFHHEGYGADVMTTALTKRVDAHLRAAEQRFGGGD